jgi:ADP-ribosyl-[dinitrogen reductase] hydrolase
MKYADRMLGGLWGAVVGDALGVPVEFSSLADRRRDPVKEMRGFGTWNQPAGTWSDDSSLLLASAESLLEGFDAQRMGESFVSWFHGGEWRPHGKVFDIGGATQRAIDQIHFGTPATLAGGTSESSNGNGSLMRILPVALAVASTPADNVIHAAEVASGITHGHAWSRMACAYYALLIRRLCHGEDKYRAVEATSAEFQTHYRQTPWAEHVDKFSLLWADVFVTLNAEHISASGFVIDTLTASVWCLLRETTYPNTVLQAVNLGGDTDTTACVTGGLAGVLYGSESVPDTWKSALARHQDLDELFQQFTAAYLP